MVAGRFNGPPDSGNGGYTCGLAAVVTRVPDPEVTLRRPPPLDVPLRVEGGDVYDGEHLVAAVASAAAVETPEPPAFPGYDAARAAEEAYAGLRDHPFPTCYVCGPRRDAGDGLRIFPGPLDDGYVAATWTPPADFADPTLGGIQHQYVWAALDCPGAWALLQQDESPIVLGRLAVRIHQPVRAGEPHVVTGWRAAPSDGRKRYAGTALWTADGTLAATGRATWIALRA